MKPSHAGLSASTTVRVFAAVLATVLAAVLALGTVAPTASAARPAPAPTGLAATVTDNQDGSYRVAATWNAVAQATAYRATLTKAGVTLASATVTDTSWSPTVSTTPGTASLSVRAVVRHRPGKTATISVPLSDGVAPQGTFTSDWDNLGVATITQVSLTDNSPVSEVQRIVDWNDGSAPEAWTTGTTIQHTYPLIANRYRPTVTLQDAAHNTRVIDVPAIVINDHQPPAGSFGVTPTTAWARYTLVTVFQDGSLVDNWTPSSKITRSVDWGDGTIKAWPYGSPLTHAYRTAGDYTPVVTITDEAHNSADVATAQVAVTADTTAPRVTLILPTARHSVKSWRTLRGRATDSGTGIKLVRLKAVEKRHGSWFGYQASTGTWVKAATKTKAFSRSRPFLLSTNARHRWNARLVGLRQGTLIYKVRAVDQVRNRSRIKTHKARLTKP
jgi:hypothetical protein